MNVCVHVRVRVRCCHSTSPALWFTSPHRYMQQMYRHVRMTTCSTRRDTSLKEMKIAFCAVRLWVPYSSQKQYATHYCYIVTSILEMSSDLIVRLWLIWLELSCSFSTPHIKYAHIKISKRNISIETWYSYNENNNWLVLKIDGNLLDHRLRVCKRFNWIFPNLQASDFMNVTLIEPIQICHINTTSWIKIWSLSLVCMFASWSSSTETEFTCSLSTFLCQYKWMRYNVTRCASIYTLLVPPPLCMYINVTDKYSSTQVYVQHNNIMNLYINLIARCESVLSSMRLEIHNSRSVSYVFVRLFHSVCFHRPEVKHTLLVMLLHQICPVNL